MWKFDNIRTALTGGTAQLQQLKDYTRKKDLNFIVAQGRCQNLCTRDLENDVLDQLLEEFADCGASMINWNGPNPSPPFLAAGLDPATRTARVMFLADLTREAEQGTASPFYSKIMGALATQFFAAKSNMDRLWFPFLLEDTVGRGAGLEPSDTGMFVVRA